METGADKIQKICDVLKKETIEPAKQEAREIVENAHLEAHEIIEKARKEAQKLHTKAKEKNLEDKKIFDSSLHLACRQTLDLLKQKIEEELFQNTLKEMISKATRDPHVVARLMNAIVGAIEADGMDADISAYIGKELSPKEINSYLLAEVRERLQEKDVLIGSFAGGVKIQLHNLQMTIDISDEAIKDLVSDYIRKDFREMIFAV